MFQAADLDGVVGLPLERAGQTHIYNQFVVRLPDRDGVRAKLEADGIGTAVYYPVPFHLQECLASLGLREGSFPRAEAAARESIALPIYPELTEEQQAHVVDLAEAGAGQGKAWSAFSRRRDLSPEEWKEETMAGDVSAAGGADVLVRVNGGEYVAVLRAAQHEPSERLFSRADGDRELEDDLVAFRTDVGHRSGSSIGGVCSARHAALLATVVPSQE